VEASPVIPRAVGAALVVGALAIQALACATAKPDTRPAPVVLAEHCGRGPFCITGEVDVQYATAVEGVRCVALGNKGESITGSSDSRGVFFLDGLAELPRDIRFEKAGFSSQTAAVIPAPARSTARVYVIMHRIDESECSCEASAIMSGHQPCPEERCGRSRFETIPETMPAAPPNPTE
jgi:hypothetical protein